MPRFTLQDKNGQKCFRKSKARATLQIKLFERYFGHNLRILLMWKLTIWMCLVFQNNAVLSVWVRNLLYNGPTNVNGLFSMKAAQTNGFEENWTKKEKSVVLTVNNWSQQTPYNSKFTTQTKWRAKMALSRKMGLRYLTRKLQATGRPSFLYRYGTPPFWKCKYF